MFDNKGGVYIGPNAMQFIVLSFGPIFDIIEIVIIFKIMFVTKLVLIISLLAFLLGLFVIFYNYRSRLHFLFGLSTGLVGIWVFLNYIFQINNSVFVLRAIYGIAPFIFLSIVLWITSLKYDKFKKSFLYFNIMIFVINFLVALISLITSGVVENVIDFYNYNVGFLFVYYVLYIVFLIIIYGIYLIKEYRDANKIFRNQIKLIMIGICMTILVAIIVSFVLPVFGITSLNILDSLSSIFFIFFSFYSIIKYKFLEIKVITAEVFAALLVILNFINFINAENLNEKIESLFVFIITLIFGILLINSVHKEIQRREELLQLTHSLERANLRLQELDRQKTEFLSIASHQLRTPLSIAKGYLELLTEGAYGKVTPETKEILKQMDKSNDHLVKLADEFLNVTRIEQGKTKFSFADKDIVELIDRVVNELKIQAKAKKLSIIWRPTKEKKMVNMDDEKIRHVIFNFIDNAIKYSNKGKIQVSWTSEKNGVAVRVKDNGFGFCKEDEVNFFQKFYRGKNVEGINVTGVGLGLFICNKFIEAHEGHVWAHSQGLGKGSEFGFWIPNKRQIKKKAE